MIGILTFETDYGPVLIEVHEAVARAAGGSDTPDGLKPKGGVVPMTGKGTGAIVGEASKRLGDAMGILRAYTATLQDVVGGLDIAPREVSVEVGLKLTGEAGFIIAKAGTEAEMKIALTWEPAPKASKTG